VSQMQSHPISFFFSSLIDLEDSTSNFFQLFLVCFYVVIRHISKNIMFGVVKLLALAKPFNGIQLMLVIEVFYWLVNITFFSNFKIHF
jgi:hypothetical protein